MFKVMKENQNYFNSPLLIFKQKNIVSSNVPTGFKSNSIILDFMASVISLTCWSLMLLYGMYWTGRAYGFLFCRSLLTNNKRTWVAPGCLFLTNRFLRYVKASCSTFCKADNILLPWGLLTQTCFHCFIFLNETLCFCNSMLNSTLSQQRAFNNSWDVFGALNFLVYASWAATRPSARNVTSTWRRSSSFCNLAMRWSLLDKRSLALQKRLSLLVFLVQQGYSLITQVNVAIPLTLYWLLQSNLDVKGIYLYPKSSLGIGNF